MPELPEVETVCLGIKPYILNKEIKEVIIRQPKLRWLVPTKLHQLLKKSSIKDIYRRGKYLILTTQAGTLLIHLGMSGQLLCLKQAQPPRKHDHVDIVFEDDSLLRFNDPRRFGCILWTEEAESHPLLKNLGPEPLSEEFNGTYLFKRSQNRSVSIKNFIMDAKIVVGVGNIYANEALFASGIRPDKSTAQLTDEQSRRLVKSIKAVLIKAIQQGGTTLKDYRDSQGNPGYFQQKLKVYGREGKPCTECGSILERLSLGGRQTVFCPYCQQ